VLLLFFSDCRIYLFSSLAARVFNKLTRYSLQTFRPQHILCMRSMHMRLSVKASKTKRRMEYKLMASPEYSLTFGIDGTRKSFGRARIDSSS